MAHQVASFGKAFLVEQLLALLQEVSDRLRLQGPADGLQIEQHVLHRLVPLTRRLAEHLGYNRLQLLGAFRHELAERGGILTAYVVHQVRGCGAVEWPLVGKQLINQDSQGPNIRAFVGVLAVILLGRHVGERAHQHTGHGPRGFKDPGNAKIHHLHRTVLVDHDVARFDVAVNNAPLMGVVEGTTSLQGVGKL